MPVISVDADSVDVLIVVSALDAIDVPITMTLIEQDIRTKMTKTRIVEFLRVV